MKYQVLYFTRTENSKRVAKKIADSLNVSLIEIKDDKNWHGLFGYIKAGFYSTANRKVKITLSDPLNTYDQLIVVGPLWAGGAAPALRTFFETYPKEKTHLVVTSIGSKIKQRGQYLSVTDIIQREENEDMMIKHLVDNLK